MTEHVFGPVPSRRLGRSLGVDLTPFKTCTYDCIYCQLGATTCKTIQRKEWFSIEAILKDLKSKLDSRPDYITLSGSGEPTLYSAIGPLIEQIKSLTKIPVAVLTNGSLLWRPEVRQAVMSADLVIPSLDAGCEETFQYVNRPCPEITFEHLLRGLRDFRKEYQGQYWLEVLIVGGVATTGKEIEKLSRCIHKISPDRVQVNTVVRPPTESFVLPVSPGRLHDIAARLHERAEVIADFQHVSSLHFAATRDEVLNLLRRRPCTVEDITDGLGLHRNEVVKYVEQLMSEGEIHKEIRNQQMYYSKSSHDKPKLR
ncbi:MAG: radical SAM protein [Sedimentisphaerales bacterium]|nr:radical SAM protein [Sedimentisphaerales bacterium]